MKKLCKTIGAVLVWTLTTACGAAEDEAVAAKAEAEVKLESGGYTNRLARESSPYLLQHAHNPVDWYPWGDEAFEKARKEGKPIFLSVGYSTCHWCHVMEHESFENAAVAAVMNEHFVCVKVDREERPDVDKVYMTFVQASTGSGGWPMSVWLTPELQPFFGGTYFPPGNFTNVLLRIAQAWGSEREKILASGESVMRQLKSMSQTQSEDGSVVQLSLLDAAYEQIKESYEPKYGGFGGAPKFPRPVVYNFMFRYYARTGAKEARDMTLYTLRKMAAGGMHDHLGGGFHRYSTDERWHVPHFEKMLYDQAQLVWSYLEAYQITREPFYAGVARDILGYVQRDMTGAMGQFYSAEDADSPVPGDLSEQAEGAFYVWEEKEIETILGRADAVVFNYHYGVEDSGNVREDPRNEFRNKNVLIVSGSVEETARKFGRTVEEIEKVLGVGRGKLFQARIKRPRPLLDDKTLTSWNGLMISAFARAAQVLGERSYLEAAEKAAGFVRANLYDPSTGRLQRRFRAGEANIDGYVDDYAFFIQALLDLYEASFEVSYLKWAVELQGKQNALFEDGVGGGFFSTTGDDPSVLLRMKDDYDGAEPSPNSISVLNLLRLSQMTGREEFGERAKKALGAFAARLGRVPMAMPQMLVAAGFQLSKPRQIVVAGEAGRPDTEAMFGQVHKRFIPERILLLADGGSGQAYLGTGLEFIRDMKMLEGKATAYVCQNYVCKLPTNDLKVMGELLGGR